ncbi:MAG: aminotransferase [Candidatus Moranbacteria bacterium RIFCSPLOWO2_12_FULL_48_12]|nr:MAG: aminotransferase [Candidatus Moranbacteria bacterium RIFCSPLOWO2_12_FULL_48_12]
MYSGIFDLPWWGYIVVTLVLTHITIAAVTIYLHRHSAHHALDLHPLVSHFFRFWLWVTTGMTTREWTAVHRKHHARCETLDDPHSPQILGIGKVMWEGADLYKVEAKNRGTLERFGRGTPDDWMEQNVYTPHSVVGIAIMMIVDFVLFGFIGITIWAVQMMWIPFFAAGIINGVGHYFGYRKFEPNDPNDASRNIVPWGIIIGGEELHNNHHAFPSSAQLSNKWWEFDIGWMYIRIMEILGLAHVKKAMPKVVIDSAKSDWSACDIETLKTVLALRPLILAEFDRRMKKAVANFMVMRILRDNLEILWKLQDSREQLLAHLQRWCRDAMSSGNPQLLQFGQWLVGCRLKSL